MVDRPLDARATRALFIAALCALVALAAGCLPTYDPDEATFNGNNGGANTNNATTNTNNATTSDNSGTNAGTTGTNSGTTGTNNATACETPTAEVCDGVDNDCDGQIDEDFPTRGVPCGNNIGVCAGVTICEGGQEVCFEVQGPEPEACDGLDNDCDGQIDELTADDPDNCGACGNVCQFDGGVAGCDRGQCVLVSCNAGFEDCDGALDNGCETNIDSDPINCGTCANICSDETAQTACVGGTCAIQACVGDRQDCNSFALDGCEADLEADIFNCGACNNRCEFPNAQALCLEQACSFEGCLDGFADLDLDTANGCEVGLRIVGSPPDASLSNLALTNGRLYGAAGNTLYGYAVEDDDSIGRLLFTTTLTSTILAVQADGDEVFVSLDAGDVQVIDTSNPDAITVAGAAITSGPAPGFDRTDGGDTLVIADGRDGLKLFDISDTASPRLIGRATSPNLINRAFVFGDRAIAANPGRADLDLYDVADPTRPEHLGTYPVETRFDQATVSGDLLITGLTGSTDIRLYRLSSDAVTFLGQSTLPGPLAGFEAITPFLVAVVQNGANVQLVQIDIRRPQRPTVLGTFDAPVPNTARSAVIANGQIIVAGSRGLQRFDITDIREPASVQDLVRPQSLSTIRATDQRLYVASDGAIEVLDTTDPANPRRLARFGESIGGFTLGTTGLVAWSGAAIARYNLGNLEGDPTGTATLAGTPSAVTISRDGRLGYAVVGSTLQVVDFDAADPAAAILSTLPLSGSCTKLMLMEPRMYAACSSGMLVLNVTEPTAPQLIQTNSEAAFYDLDVFGVNLYAVSDNAIGIYQIDAQGTLVARGLQGLDATGLRYLTSLGTWMVAGSSSDLFLVDRSVQDAPQRIVNRTLSGTVVGLSANSDFIYAGTSQGVFRLALEGQN